MSDYSDIQAELNDFKNAVYGEEVRDSMISAIKKIHDTAESAADDSTDKSSSAILDGLLGEFVLTNDLFITGKSLQSNGGTTDNASRSVSNYIFCPKGSYIEVEEGYRFNIGKYSGLTASTLIEYTTFGTDRCYIESDCYIRFTVASLEDATVVDADTALSAFNGLIVKSSNLYRLSGDFGEVLSDTLVECGSIAVTGENITATSRMRSTSPLFISKGAVIENNSGVSIAWRRYSDSAETNCVQSSQDFASGDITIPVSGWYRFIFQQNYWFNGNLAMLVSLNEPANAYADYPIIYAPSEAYKYNGSDIPLDIVNGSGNMLTTLYGWYDALVASYPNHIIKSVIGTDQSGSYELRCYTINSYSSSAKPKVLWISGIHASEPYTHTATYIMVKELLENHESNPVLDFIWSNCTLMVVPIANPWGLANGGVRYNSRGVNLNRNFSVDWEYSDEQYNNSGSAPESEAETQAIVSFVKNNTDAIFAVNKHDSDTFASQNYRFGYDVSAKSVDRAIFRTLWAKMDSEIKANYPWVLSNVPNAATFNLFRNLSASENHGTMDKWFNAYGMNGCLYEVSRPSDSDFTKDYKQDFLKIGLETSVAMISAVVEHNQLLKDARDGAKRKVTDVASSSGGDSITVDSALSDTSENPVQNKVIKDALDSKVNSNDLGTAVIDGIESYNAITIQLMRSGNAVTLNAGFLSLYNGFTVGAGRIYFVMPNSQTDVVVFTIDRIDASQSKIYLSSVVDSTLYEVALASSGTDSMAGTVKTTSLSAATTATAGLMSATDKANLDTLYADYLSASTALG